MLEAISCTSTNLETVLLNTPFARVQVARVEQVLADSPSALETWLSSSELARLDRLKIQNRRNQYLSGHWLVRCLLSQHFGKSSTEWQLIERKDLPPAVQDFDLLQISISHSGDWIAAAISNSAIGIDLEQRRERAGLMRFQHLLLAQNEPLDSLDSDQLLQRWVAKEAWIKRHHGSALPEQLAELKLISASPENASVQIWGTAAFHLAITAQAESATWQANLAKNAILQTEYWRLESA